MNRNLQPVFLALAAGITGLAIGRIHQEWQREEAEFLRRFDRADDPGAAFGRIREPRLGSLDGMGVVALPPPVPPPPKERKAGPFDALGLLRRDAAIGRALSKAAFEGEAAGHLALGVWCMPFRRDKAREEFGIVLGDFGDSSFAGEAGRLRARLDERPRTVAVVAPIAPPEPPKSDVIPVAPPPPESPDDVRPPDPLPPEPDPVPGIEVGPVRHRSVVPEAVEADRLYAGAMSAKRASPHGTPGFQAANREARKALLRARALYEAAAARDAPRADALGRMIVHVNLCIYECMKSANIND